MVIISITLRQSSIPSKFHIRRVSNNSSFVWPLYTCSL